MKQTYTYHTSVIASTASKIKPEAFDSSIEAFEKGEYLKSLHALLDYIDKDLRNKYGNPQGNKFSISHESIHIHLTLSNDTLQITVPLVTLPEENRIAIMRQIVGLNFNDLDLAGFHLKEDRLYLEYSCPIAFSHPAKIYHVLKEICRVSAKYDYEFQDSFHARKLEKPSSVPYAPEKIDYIYNTLQQSCRECLDALRYFEPLRKFNDMWNIIDTTLLKIMYVAHPQGKLLHTLQQALRDMDRDIPMSSIIASGKQTIKELQEKNKEELAESLYSTEVFISDKQRSNLQNIRENFEKCYKQVAVYMESGDYRSACIRIIHKFYEAYAHNQMQEDLDHLFKTTMSQTSALPWAKAAPVLYETLKNIMEGSFKTNPGQNPIAA